MNRSNESMGITLVVEYINGEHLIENIRTAKIDSSGVTYYRNDYYPAVEVFIDFKDVSNVKIISGGHCVYDSTKTVDSTA